MLQQMESIKKGGGGGGANSDHILQKRKNATIKAKKGQMASTVVAKVMYDFESDSGFWKALVTWKQANIQQVHLFASDLLDLVKQVKKIVCEGLLDLMGIVQEVDVIFKLPMIDHKITITFKQAMKTIEWEEEERPII